MFALNFNFAIDGAASLLGGHQLSYRCVHERIFGTTFAISYYSLLHTYQADRNDKRTFSSELVKLCLTLQTNKKSLWKPWRRHLTNGPFGEKMEDSGVL